jgi:hypothetical protein
MARLTAAMLLFLTVAAPSFGTQSITEDQVKAAYLFNFAKFIEWPADAFPAANAPMNFCTLGHSPVVDEIDASVRGKNIGDHTIVVKHLHAVEEMKDCHLVFLAAGASKQEQKLIQAAKGAPLLLVSEIPGFSHAGGTINFVMEDGRLLFEVNVKAAESAHLKISAKLLTMARITSSDEGQQGQ